MNKRRVCREGSPCGACGFCGHGHMTGQPSELRVGDPIELRLMGVKGEPWGFVGYAVEVDATFVDPPYEWSPVIRYQSVRRAGMESWSVNDSGLVRIASGRSPVTP